MLNKKIILVMGIVLSLLGFVTTLLNDSGGASWALSPPPNSPTTWCKPGSKFKNTANSATQKIATRLLPYNVSIGASAQNFKTLDVSKFPINDRGCLYPSVGLYPSNYPDASLQNKPIKFNGWPTQAQGSRDWDKAKWYKDEWMRKQGLDPADAAQRADSNAQPPGGWGNYEIHHILPREWGGDDTWENLVPLPKTQHLEYSNWWRSSSQNITNG
jgi:hypothetical protein